MKVKILMLIARFNGAIVYALPYVDKTQIICISFSGVSEQDIIESKHTQKLKYIYGQQAVDQVIKLFQSNGTYVWQGEIDTLTDVGGYKISRETHEFDLAPVQKLESYSHIPRTNDRRRSIERRAN